MLQGDFARLDRARVRAHTRKDATMPKQIFVWRAKNLRDELTRCAPDDLVTVHSYGEDRVATARQWREHYALRVALSAWRKVLRERYRVPAVVAHARHAAYGLLGTED